MSEYTPEMQQAIEALKARLRPASDHAIASTVAGHTPTEVTPLPPLGEWIAWAAAQMQRDAIRQAEAAGAVSLRYVDTAFEPDGRGGYVMNGEWEMGVPRG